MLGKGYFLHTARPAEKDRSSPVTIPGPIDDWRVVASGSALAEWGDDRSRYQDAQSVQELAGTAPVPFQSGNFAKAHKRFACVKPLRNVLHQFAWQTTLCEPWAKAYYQRKRAQGKSHSMAVRCLANVWVRILFRMSQDEIYYQRTIFETAQEAHAQRIA
ncbi:MAG TPA: transposase [Ktedonobacteraceae bacterium]|nr:transposase [Ktedonobacteraceae bacterium]